MRNLARFLSIFIVFIAVFPKTSSLPFGLKTSTYFESGACLAKETVKYVFNDVLVDRFAYVLNDAADQTALTEMKNNLTTEINNLFANTFGPAVVMESGLIFMRYVIKLTRFVSSRTTIDAVYKSWVSGGFNATQQWDAIEGAFSLCWPGTEF